MNSQPLYKKTANGWQFRFEGEDVLFEAKEIAILYTKSSEGTVTVLKHGPKKTVETEMEKSRDAYSKARIETSHHITDVSNALESELNAVIGTSAIPEKRILELSNPFIDNTIKTYVLLTRDCNSEIKHLIAGGKVLVDDPTKSLFKTYDLAVIFKEQKKEGIEPELYTHELIVWPDGTEVSKDDFSEREHLHMSDDYEQVLDMDEDTRAYIQKAIMTTLSPHMGLVTKLYPNISPEKIGAGEASLLGIPKTPQKKEVSPAYIESLAAQEATIENETAYQNAKRSLSKDAVALNEPINLNIHHIPAYRDAARKSILSLKEPAEISNYRLKALELGIKSALAKRTKIEVSSKQKEEQGHCEKIIRNSLPTKNPTVSQEPDEPEPA